MSCRTADALSWGRCSAVKAAAKAAGAHGCTISGAGPTCVAVVADAQVGHAAHLFTLSTALLLAWRPCQCADSHGAATCNAIARKRSLQRSAL